MFPVWFLVIQALALSDEKSDNSFLFQNSWHSLIASSISFDIAIYSLKAETHYATNRCDTSPWQVAATNLLVCHVKVIVAAIEFCCCNLSQRQTSLNSCDISQRQNKRKQLCRSVCTRLWQVAATKFKSTMREHQLVSHNVEFYLFCISSLPKSIACTKQVSHCSDLSQQQCRRGDLSPWYVALICCIVCLGIKLGMLHR